MSVNSFHAAGVLPYCMIRDEKYYLLGQGRFDLTLSDFGGKRARNGKRHESKHECAARECHEELGILGDAKKVLTLLQDTRITTSYKICKTVIQKKTGKEAQFIYNLFTINVQPDMWQSEFSPTPGKRAIVWIKATDLYYSILAQNGIVTIDDQQVLLRDAFKQEISALPEYKEFVKKLLTSASQIQPFVPSPKPN